MFNEIEIAGMCLAGLVLFAIFVAMCKRRHRQKSLSVHAGTIYIDARSHNLRIVWDMSVDDIPYGAEQLTWSVKWTPNMSVDAYMESQEKQLL